MVTQEGQEAWLVARWSLVAPTGERLSGSEVVIRRLPSGRPWGPCRCFLPHARHLWKYKDQVPGRSQPQMLLGIKLLKL